MPKKFTTGRKLKYRIKKTIRDVNRPLGVDYTPEAYVSLVPGTEADWQSYGQFYTEEEALDILRKLKAVDDIKVEYIYPEL